MQTTFRWKLIWVRVLWVSILHRTEYILANIKRTIACITVPPSDKFLIICRTIANFPINLWYAIVYPTIVYPLQYVGIEVVIVLQTICTTAMLWVVLLITIDTERRHTKLHPRLTTTDRLAQLLDKEVYIITSPIVDIGESTSVTLEISLVWNSLSCSRIRIEIVINMQAINIISTHYIVNDCTDIIAILWQRRVEDIKTIVREDTIRVGYRNMIRCQLCGILCLCTIRINPRMEFHTTIVTLRNHPLQWVPIRRRRCALTSCKELTPWLILTWIERITLSTHLKDDSIHTISLQFVQLIT